MPQSRQNDRFRLLNWLGGHELGILVLLLAVTAGVWIFATLANDVREGETNSFDRRILLSLRHADLTPLGPPSVQEAVRDVSALGSDSLLGLATLIVAGFLVLDGKSRMAVFAAVSVIGGGILSTLLKDFFQRPRPEIVPHLAYAANTSFPSGHSMMSALTYLTLAALLARSQERRRIKAYFLLLAVLIAFLVGVSRIYLGVHWPTDVLAGWTAGTTWALICWLIARSLQRRKALEPEAQREGR
ncbi:MAG TPA: phosphatase PAP2 family protein [Bryobacteraceae bacterium]|jgi:undecaprenyl-diphosphatase|nr:phosphatase PAP2 family protein [Bryobacteraceae bacterium]